MGRARRMFESGELYDICIRTSKDLPFAANDLVSFLILSAFARASREERVEITYHLWMGNHAHLGVIPGENLWEFTKFYGELQKNLTEMIKRLTGKSRLRMWDYRPMVANVLDFEEAKERIKYAYLNPVKANLVSSIEQYPGLSSWNEFKQSCQNLAHSRVDSQYSTEVLRVRLSTIPRLLSLSPSSKEIHRIIKEIKANNEEYETLTIKPNLWFKVYGIDDPIEILRINQQILEEIRLEEKYYLATSKKVILGRNKLINQQICKKHLPKERKRKIFFLTSCVELAQAFISKFLEYDERCLTHLGELIQGIVHDNWPKNAFRPPLPNLA